MSWLSNVITGDLVTVVLIVGFLGAGYGGVRLLTLAEPRIRFRATVWWVVAACLGNGAFRLYVAINRFLNIEYRNETVVNIALILQLLIVIAFGLAVQVWLIVVRGDQRWTVTHG